MGWPPFARHYWGDHCCFLFLEVLRCFSSLRSPPHPMVRVTALQAAGLSHSETRGSKVICTSPRIIAAYRVLHRLREPRHPPCALALFLARDSPNKGGAEYTLRRPAHRVNTRRGPALLLLLLLVQHAKERCWKIVTPQGAHEITKWLIVSSGWRITDSNR